MINGLMSVLISVELNLHSGVAKVKQNNSHCQCGYHLKKKEEIRLGDGITVKTKAI